jgi:hypothetical protein
MGNWRVLCTVPTSTSSQCSRTRPSPTAAFVRLRLNPAINEDTLNTSGGTVLPDTVLHLLALKNQEQRLNQQKEKNAIVLNNSIHQQDLKSFIDNKIPAPESQFVDVSDEKYIILEYNGYSYERPIDYPNGKEDRAFFEKKKKVFIVDILRDEKLQSLQASDLLSQRQVADSLIMPKPATNNYSQSQTQKSLQEEKNKAVFGSEMVNLLPRPADPEAVKRPGTKRGDNPVVSPEDKLKEQVSSHLRYEETKPVAGNQLVKGDVMIATSKLLTEEGRKEALDLKTAPAPARPQADAKVAGLLNLTSGSGKTNPFLRGTLKDLDDDDDDVGFSQIPMYNASTQQ